MRSAGSVVDDGVLKIGEVARRAGVSVRALRYYEEQGLLETVRSSAGHRLYDETAVERVRFYQQLYAAGLTSGNIAQLLPCVDSGHTDHEQRAMLHQQRALLRDRMDDLAAAIARLDTVIAEADARS
ncbi:MerR family transcriptional regulator [Isoptericola sp. NPDC019693]|uniref:MerR family transcriptional regulator n=1 Tax=Isoptericola sp. NPDC019693 TaxID=3364009 RepID=UPI003796B8BB